MEKYILNALRISDRKYMDIFHNKIRNKGRLYIVAGKPHVGKSAFLFKLLNFISKTNQKYLPVLFIHFDDSIEYWKNQFNSDILKNITFKYFPKGKKSLGMYLNKKVTENNYQTLIIDGIYNNKDYENIAARHSLILELIDLSYFIKIPIFITERNNKVRTLPKRIFQSHRPTLPEIWFLERPEYYIGEIEKGDCRLYLY